MSSGENLLAFGPMRDPLELLRENRAKRDKCAADMKALDAELAGPGGLVDLAMSAGATGPQIAKLIGLSKPRVYQIRQGTR